MMKKYFLLLFFGIFMGCSSDDAQLDGIQVRVCNLSEYDFKNVKVDLNDSEKNYRDIDSHKYSRYIKHDTAYGYGFVHIEVDGQTYELIPVDYVGESLIEDGKYTYYLDFETISPGNYTFTSYMQLDE